MRGRAAVGKCTLVVIRYAVSVFMKFVQKFISMCGSVDQYLIFNTKVQAKL